jgi:hypothetical protein
MDGTVTDVKVHVDGITHTHPDDMELLLVAPSGETVLLMSDVGGLTDVTTPLNLVFDDAAGGPIPAAGPLVGGTFTPSDSPDIDCSGDAGFPGPAPAGPYGSTLGSLAGVSPNGTWQMFAYDDCGVDVGSAARWSLHLTTTG